MVSGDTVNRFFSVKKPIGIVLKINLAVFCTLILFVASVYLIKNPYFR